MSEALKAIDLMIDLLMEAGETQPFTLFVSSKFKRELSPSDLSYVTKRVVLVEAN